jgi:hypothetical protein
LPANKIIAAERPFAQLECHKKDAMRTIPQLSRPPRGDPSNSRHVADVPSRGETGRKSLNIYLSVSRYRQAVAKLARPGEFFIHRDTTKPYDGFELLVVNRPR